MDSHLRPNSPRRGRFWIAEKPDVRVPGAFSCSDGPTLEVDQPLTPALHQLHSDGGQTRAFAPAEEGPEHESHVVHGLLTDSGEQVTLVDAFTAGRRYNPFDPANGDQRLVARCGLLGGHVDAATQFSHVRLRLEHLETWAALPGFSLTWSDDGSELGCP